MSQNARGDPERGNNPDGDRSHRTWSAPNRPSKEELSFGDSSGPFFSMYSNAAEDQDNNMVKSWQKDADGILIFTGLFSAAVAALLGVTVQDLRPNSQDTSAFYLGNIYDVLADPNVTRASISSPVAKPPPFSAPRYAVWVNSLWFLSLVMSLSCALLATSLQQWARRYVRLTQPARRSPEKRARMRAYYANGVEDMHIPWAVEGLPTLLHLSLFLFFGGLVIFLFNVDEKVFTSVVCWIGLFVIVYGLITLLPLIRQDTPYYTPLSKPAWFLYASLPYATFTVLAFIIKGFELINYGPYGRDRVYRIHRNVFWRRHHYRSWISGGLEKKAEEMTEEQSSEIDVQILGWTIGSIGDDDSLEEFFGAIPGLFSSNLVKNLETTFPDTLLFTFWFALYKFMRRTLSSNSVTESVKSRRVTICKDIMSVIPRPYTILPDPLCDFFDQAPVSIERLQVMARWSTHMSTNVSNAAQIRAAKSLPRVQDRDDRWIALASDVYGLSKSFLQQNVALGGDNVLLAILINICHIDSDLLRVIEALTEFDIRHTLPGLQHDFCMLWNKLVQEADDRWSSNIWILCRIRQLYISLHQGTDAAPTSFSASTDRSDPILLQLSSYPLCDIASHCRVSNSPSVPLLAQPGDLSDALHCSTSRGSTYLQQVKHENIAVPSSPSHPTTSNKIGGRSQDTAATGPALQAHASSHSTDASPGGPVAAPLQNISLATISSPTPEGTTHIVTADAPVAFNPLLPVSSVVSFSIPTFTPSPHTPLLPSAESLALLSSRTPSRPTGNSAIPRIRPRGLVNTENMCFVNAVFQLIVHSPPFWNLSRELVDLSSRRGERGPETGGGATPLVDATVRFFDEFTFKEKESPQAPTQQTLQQAASDIPREDEEEKRENKVVDSFEPTYMFDAMKDKRQLENLLDGKHDDAEQFLGLYLDALDEELVELHSTREPSAAPSVEKHKGEAQPVDGHTEVGKRYYTASSVDSPISRIFGGRSLSTICVPSQPDTVTIEAWRSLQLNIQHNSVHNVQDALVRLSQPQPVEVGQSSSNEASQQVLLEALPPILILHLKRFVYDAATEGIVKISKPVQFAPDLEIPLEIMAPVFRKSIDPVHYKLHGVLYHHGESAGGGRYTVNVLHLNGESGSGEVWLHIDNETMSKVRHDDVFGYYDNERVGEGFTSFLEGILPLW